MGEALGTSARIICGILQKNREVAISKLPKMMEESDATTYQALSCLAREGKIEYRFEGHTAFVSLIK